MKINVSASSPYFSVVIPLHNEEPNLLPPVQGLTPVMGKLDKPYEIILVDDGSTDGSYDAMKILSKEYSDIVLVRFRKCYGQTAALDAGFRQALGQVIITLDGDLQYDPQDILEMIPSLNGADLVCGYQAKREDNWIRRLSSMIANGVRNWMTEETVRDVGFVRSGSIGDRSWNGSGCTTGFTDSSRPSSRWRGSGWSRSQSSASRADFEWAARDLALAESEYPGWLSRLRTHPVRGLENYRELFDKLNQVKDAIKVYCEVADFSQGG